MMKNELISSLLGLAAMRDTKLIDIKTYEESIGQLCDEHGTEFVAGIMMTLGLV